MSAEGDQGTNKDNPGTRQRLVFFLVAMIVSGLGLLLGGPTVGYIAFLLFGALFVLFFAGKLRRLVLFLFLLLAVVLLVGGLAYSRLSSDEMVARVGSWPLIGSFYEHKAVQLGLAALAGLIGGLLAVGGPLLLMISVSVEWFLALRETHELDRKLALKLLLFLALGIGEPYFIVDEGKITMTKPKGPLSLFGAPAVAVVRPYNAVVLQRSGEVTQIEGSGTWTLRKFETLKAAVDLRPQGRSFEWKALTKDNVPLTGNGFVRFGIEPWEQARKRDDKGDFQTRDFKGIISGPYPVYRRTLYRAVYRVVAGIDWQLQVVGMAQGRIAAAVRGFRVDEIFVVDERERVTMEQTALQQITDQAKSGAINAGYNWGVQVDNLNITAIKMPEEAQKEFVRRWGEPWRGWREIRRAESKQDVAKIEADITLSKARVNAEAAFLKGRAKAQALEEQYRRTLGIVIDYILNIQDEEWRVQAVFEVIRNLQPVDKRMLSVMLDRGRLLERGLDPGLLDSGKDRTEEG